MAGRKKSKSGSGTQQAEDTAREGVFAEKEDAASSSPSGLGSSRTEEEQRGRLDTESVGIGRTFIGQSEARGEGGRSGEHTGQSGARGASVDRSSDDVERGPAREGSWDEELGEEHAVGAGRTARDAEGR